MQAPRPYCIHCRHNLHRPQIPRASHARADREPSAPVRTASLVRNPPTADLASPVVLNTLPGAPDAWHEAHGRLALHPSRAAPGGRTSREFGVACRLGQPFS
ncbi:hypothetical protein GCM10009804_75240 [Kribbella hippodromi]|uniref:Uncharacterized protein n=1 Tax=Kribbella hippodromi TaxID=434347 RepID=A0ABN2EJC4_9ACTN